MGAIVYNQSNGHYYEYVSTNVTWSQALDLSVQKTYNGLNGYLATITSASEDAFVRSVANNSNIWLSGSDAGHEGLWQWVAGPEAGQAFTYTSWAPGEPNGPLATGNVYLQIFNNPFVGGYNWNDQTNTSTWGTGYVVEYSGSQTSSSVSINDVTVTERNSGTTLATFTVTRTGGTGTFSVNYATSDATATLADNDYTSTSGTLSFASGETSKTVSVSVKGDTKVEANETFNLNLSNATNGVIITDSQGIGTIANDDKQQIAALIDTYGTKIVVAGQNGGKLPKISNTSNGNIAIIWEGMNNNLHSNTDINSQLYAPDGSLIGNANKLNNIWPGEFATNLNFIDEGRNIASLNNGGLAVVWSDYTYGQDKKGIYDNVKCQVIDPSGTKIGNEIQISNASSVWDAAHECVATLANGSIVVAWDDGGPQNEKFRILSSDGSSISNIVEINWDRKAGSQGNDIGITPLSNGSFVISWHGWTGGNQGDAKFIVFDQNGTAITTRLTTNEQIITSGQAAHEVKVTDIGSGHLVATWSQSGGSDISQDVYGQIFDYSGNKIGNEFRVNSEVKNDQHKYQIEKLSNGSFVVAWEDWSNVLKNYSEIRAQIFDSFGNKINSEFIVNTTLDGGQEKPRIVALDNNYFGVSWKSQVSGAYADIKIQLFNGNGSKVGGEYVVQQSPQANGYSDFMLYDLSDYQISSNHSNMISITWESVAGIFAQSYKINVGDSPVSSGRNVHDIQITSDNSLVYRLYQAAFSRSPDETGYRYWVDQHNNHNISFNDMSIGFINSVEFQSKYGTNPSNDQLVGLLYQNVLGRPGESSGVSYWTNELSTGHQTKQQILLSFAGSPENVAKTAPNIDNGYWLV